jgi:outer membrane protein assembly factor BamE
MHRILRFFTLLSAIALVGCGSGERTIKPFKMEIQQGNVVTSEMLLKLRPGMTKSQVQFIMGTPLLVDSFHTNRWDYFYQLRKQGEIINQRRVILDFDGDALAKVRGDVVPQGTDVDALMQQAGSGAKVDAKVAVPVVEDSKADLIATPIEMPEIESATITTMPEKAVAKPLESVPQASQSIAPAAVEAKPIDAASVSETPAETAQEVVTPESTVETVVKKDANYAIEDQAVLAQPVLEMAPSMVEAAPVALPQAETSALQESAIAEPARVQMESADHAEKVEAIYPPVVEAEPKAVKTKRPKIPAPPVVEYWFKKSAKPIKTEMATPPTSSPSTKTKFMQAAPAVKKAGDDSLPNEEDPGFFERTLEMIGF